jgi:hypothetical protein
MEGLAMPPRAAAIGHALIASGRAVAASAPAHICVGVSFLRGLKI